MTYQTLVSHLKNPALPHANLLCGEEVWRRLVCEPALWETIDHIADGIRVKIGSARVEVTGDARHFSLRTWPENAAATIEDGRI